MFRTFGTVATTAGAFDIYFRIGLPNGANYDIEQHRFNLNLGMALVYQI